MTAARSHQHSPQAIRMQCTTRITSAVHGISGCFEVVQSVWATRRSEMQSRNTTFAQASLLPLLSIFAISRFITDTMSSICPRLIVTAACLSTTAWNTPWILDVVESSLSRRCFRSLCSSTSQPSQRTIPARQHTGTASIFSSLLFINLQRCFHAHVDSVLI